VQQRTKGMVDIFVANVTLFVSVQKFWRSVKFRPSYRKLNLARFLGHSVCRIDIVSKSKKWCRRITVRDKNVVARGQINRTQPNFSLSPSPTNLIVASVQHNKFNRHQQWRSDWDVGWRVVYSQGGCSVSPVGPFENVAIRICTIL